MFRHPGFAIGIFRSAEGQEPSQRSMPDRLTVIAARLEWLHVPPRKGGTFCFFRGPAVDAARTAAASNL